MNRARSDREAPARARGLPVVVVAAAITAAAADGILLTAARQIGRYKVESVSRIADRQVTAGRAPPRFNAETEPPQSAASFISSQIRNVACGLPQRGQETDPPASTSFGVFAHHSLGLARGGICLTLEADNGCGLMRPRPKT